MGGGKPAHVAYVSKQLRRETQILPDLRPHLSLSIVISPV